MPVEWYVLSGDYDKHIIMTSSTTSNINQDWRGGGIRCRLMLEKKYYRF
jgi:hypothetical protein